MEGTVNSQQILAHIEQWAQGRKFTAPYGILRGSHVNKKGVKYLSMTFGRAGTLDATVEIYNRNFMILRTSRHGSQVYKNFADLQLILDLCRYRRNKYSSCNYLSVIEFLDVSASRGTFLLTT
jgi:hypothetical protein